MMPTNRPNTPYSGLASLMALKGREGDTELVHMSKPEVAKLAALGGLGMNPATGLPETHPMAPVGVLRRADGGDLDGGDGGYADYGGGQAAMDFGTLPGEAGYADYGGGQAAAPAGSLSSDVGYGEFDGPWGTGQAGKAKGWAERQIEGIGFALKDKINNPAATFLDVLIGGIPLFGQLNTLSGLTTGKTLGGAITSGIRDLTGSTESKYSPSFVMDAITGAGRGLSSLASGITNSAGSNFISSSAPVSGPAPSSGASSYESFAGTNVPPVVYAEGGIIHGSEYHEGMVNGQGDGQSDHVPFKVEGGDTPMALLSRDEYVLPADVVAMIGSGSSNAGAERLDKFVKSVRKESYGTSKQMPAMKDGGIASLMNT